MLMMQIMMLDVNNESNEFLNAENIEILMEECLAQTRESLYLKIYTFLSDANNTKIIK